VNVFNQRAALDRERENRLFRIALATDLEASRQESKACNAEVESEQHLRVVLQRTEKVLPQLELE